MLDKLQGIQEGLFNLYWKNQWEGINLCFGLNVSLKDLFMLKGHNQQSMMGSTRLLVVKVLQLNQTVNPTESMADFWICLFQGELLFAGLLSYLQGTDIVHMVLLANDHPLLVIILILTMITGRKKWINCS